MATAADSDNEEARRRVHLDRLYALIACLSARRGAARRLGGCSGRDDWPPRGVYLLLETGEAREDGVTPRVVRVGTHALADGSRTLLWGRLRQHRGTVRNGPSGNHRGSVLRLHVGAALLAAGADWSEELRATWGHGKPSHEARLLERPLERAVSERIGAMQVLVLRADDPPGPESLRGFIERNLIGLLSNAGRAPIDPPSAGWLGRFSPKREIREAGLWNVNHVRDAYDASALDEVANLVRQDSG